MTNGVTKNLAEQDSEAGDPGIWPVPPVFTSLASQTTANVAATLAASHACNKAHLVMLIEEQFVDRDTGGDMLRALREIDEHDGRAPRDAGEGRHSDELGSVACKLTIRKLAVEQLDALQRLRRAAIHIERAHAEIIMPAASHLQPGQPSTCGHWAKKWNQVFGRNFSRTLQLFHRVNVISAPAAITPGTDSPLNRQRRAQLLGFSAVMEHNWDAVQSSDDLTEAAGVFATVGADIERLGADLQLFFSTELTSVGSPERYLDVPIEDRDIARGFLFVTAARLIAQMHEDADLLRSVQLNSQGLSEAGRSGPAGANHLAQLERDTIAIDDDQRELDNIKSLIAAGARQLESAIDSILRVAYRSKRPPLVVAQSPGYAHTCCG